MVSNKKLKLKEIKIKNQRKKRSEDLQQGERERY